MQEHEKDFKNSDNLKLFYYEWLPDNAIRGVVFVVHGIGEYSGRYRHVAEAFTSAGLATYAIDHRGHGKSDGDRIFFTDLQQFVDDLRQLFDMVKAQYPDKPLLMYGHSMGSLISLAFALQYQAELGGLVLTGTAITGDLDQPAILKGIVMLVSRIAPKLRLSPVLPPQVLSTDPFEVTKYANDPLVYHGMWPTATSAALFKGTQSLRENVHQLTLPMLVMHGADDELTPSSGATYLDEHVQSTDKTVKILPGMRHELVNEVKRDEIIQEISDWLVAHLSN